MSRVRILLILMTPVNRPQLPHAADLDNSHRSSSGSSVHKLVDSAPGQLYMCFNYLLVSTSGLSSVALRAFLWKHSNSSGWVHAPCTNHRLRRASRVPQLHSLS